MRERENAHPRICLFPFGRVTAHGVHWCREPCTHLLYSIVGLAPVHRWRMWLFERLLDRLGANGGESLYNLLLVGRDALIRDDELEYRGVFLGAIDVVFNVECPNFIGRWEALDLAIRDGTHKGGLASTVFATKTITVATFRGEGWRC
jgi:hypothetical protein